MVCAMVGLCVLWCMCVCICVMVCLYVCYGVCVCVFGDVGSSRYLTGEEFVFRVQNSTGQTCLTASFQLTFDLYYENVTYNGSSTFINVTVSGWGW